MPTHPNPTRSDLDHDERLKRLGREWFAQVRGAERDEASATRKRRRDSGTGDGDGGWLDGWFSSDCAGDADASGGDCGD